MGIAEILAALVEIFLFLLFPGKGLDHMVTGNVLLSGGVHLAQLVAHLHKQGTHTAGIELGDDGEQRRNRHQRQRQLPVDKEQIDGRGKEHGDAVHHHVIDIAEEMAAPVRIGGKAGHQIAGTVAVEETHILVLQPGKQPHT